MLKHHFYNKGIFNAILENVKLSVELVVKSFWLERIQAYLLTQVLDVVDRQAGVESECTGANKDFS